MMTPWFMFTVVLAIGGGVIAVGFLLLIALWLTENAARMLDDFSAAARRYAVRNEVITEYYDATRMEYVRKITDATPYRVTVAKRDAKK
jgi:hypothetical protein